MNFDQSVKYLYGLGNEVLAMKLGLENIGKLLTEFGDPQSRFFKVQVAGTNGKGSTCAFLEAICLDAGIRVGTTTSPHLVSVTERIRIDGQDISEELFAKYATKIRKASEKLVKGGSLETVPTFFEQVTAIALLAFADAEVELAILETGLGGRFDATTAARAEIVAITRIDLDHQRILGNSVADIASEKAAIIRSDATVVVGEQPAEAMHVIEARCREYGVVPILGSEVRVERNGELTGFQTESGRYPNVRIGLPGEHQIENAAVAVRLAEELRKRFNISAENIARGLGSARHRGRLERRGRFLFDGAHNENGAAALHVFLDENISEPVVMIFGAMRDKELGNIAATLFPKAGKLILTRPENPRSMDAAEIGKLGRDFCEEVFLTSTVAEAVKLAQGIAGADQTIVVTGSLYLVGEALAELESKGTV
ncbi:MAG: bifunctional folylpolyglutamate synthase/dihydrofolate synthase [Acidobacteria bacterium]|nr:bifunctional folylpolyglutamate synthase/dihydrofolate synthase [Acidobacteriota bacterium]